MKAQHLLQEHGFRNTAPRRRLLDYLLERGGMASLNDIYTSLNEKVDRATVYRTLKAFSSKGLLHSFTGPEEDTIYEVCMHSHSENEPHDNHAHFICNSCKQVVCMEGSAYDKSAIPEGFEVDEVVVVCKGTCKACQAKEA